MTELTKSKKENSNILPLTLVILGAMAVRLYKLGGQSLWYDESFSVYVAGQDLVSLTQHTAGDIHPPLYYYLLHFWMLVMGKSEFSVAFLSLFFGILVIVLTYALSRRLFDPKVALTAALLVAASPFQLWYSQEVRMYTIAACLGLILIWSVISLTGSAGDKDTGGRDRWLPWAGYVLSAALSLYLLYYLAFLLIFINLYVCFVWAKNLSKKHQTDEHVSLLKWALAQVAVIVLYLPWLPTAVSQAISPAVPPWREFVALGSVVSQSWSALSLGQSVDASKVWPLLILFAIVYFAGLLRAGSRLRGMLLFGTVWIPVLIIFLISLVTPLFFVRYVFIYAPLFFITLALGLEQLRKMSVVVFLLVFFALTGGFANSSFAYFSDNEYAADDFRSAVKYIEDRWHPGDALLLNAGYIYPEAVYYFDDPIDWRGRLSDYPKSEMQLTNGIFMLQTGSIGADNRLGGGDHKADFYPTTAEAVQRDLDYVAQHNSRLWVLRCYDTVTDPQGFIRSWLDRNATKFEDQSFTGKSILRVQAFLLPSPKQPAATTTVSFANKLSLMRADVTPGVVRAGEKIFVDLAWQSSVTLEDIRSYLALTDVNGRIWQQQDVIPVSRLFPSSKWPNGQTVVDSRQLKVMPGTPPGNYSIRLGVYGEKSGQIYDVLDSKGISRGPQATLAQIRIESAEANVDPPEMKVKTGRDFGDGLRMLGYNPGTQQAKPGDSVHLEFLWQSTKSSLSDRKIRLNIISTENGKSVATREWVPVDGRHPVSNWQAGELVRDQYDMPLPANIPDGVYKLSISLGNIDQELYRVTVKGRPHEFELPSAIQYRKDALFGDSIRLLGLNVKMSGANGSGQVSAGEQIQATIYWQAEKEVDQSYKVFLQLLDASNKIMGQRDFLPGDGTLPTTSWVKGEVITESTSIQVDKNASTGKLRLVLGVYEPTSGKRLAATDNAGQALGDALEITQIEVKGPG